MVTISEGWFVHEEYCIRVAPIPRKVHRVQVCPALVNLDEYDSSDDEEELRQEAETEDDRVEDLASNLEGLTDWDDTNSQLRPGYSQHSITIAKYLTTLKRPASIKEMSSKEFHKFKREALTFQVHKGDLFKRASKNVPLRRVVDNGEDRLRILEAMHDETGHRGKEGHIVELQIGTGGEI